MLKLHSQLFIQTEEKLWEKREWGKRSAKCMLFYKALWWVVQFGLLLYLGL